MRPTPVLALAMSLGGLPTLSAQRPCSPAAPLDSVFTIGPSTEAVWSDGVATYADGGGCYTVDFKVSNAAPAPGLTGTIRFEAGARVSGPGWKLGEHFSIPDVPELCGVYPPLGPSPQYQQTTTIYRRRSGEREFTLLASKLTTGTWGYTTCTLELPHWDFQQPLRGTDIYRVAVRVKAGQYWRPVRVKAARLPTRRTP
jgi:hypothetical protein